MARITKRRSKKAGLPPGSLVHIGEKRAGSTRLRVFNYNQGRLEEKDPTGVEECLLYKGRPDVTWINVDGLHETRAIERLGSCFGVHPLILEDIVNTDQRPKLEDFGDMIFAVLKMLYFDEARDELVVEQVSLVFGENYVLSFQEEPEHDVFEPVRARLRSGKGKTRSSSADYLVYSLIDSVVDNYFSVLERMGERIEELEAAIVADPRPECVTKLHHLKREAIFLRKSVWPLRELVDQLSRSDNPIIKDSTRIFFRDVYDHTVQVIDMVETFRDLLAGLLDIYLSTLSNRTNHIMKVLTMFTALFIPLTFIVGVYGMNFDYMPELRSKWGYPAVLSSMAAIAAGILYYFRRKKWI